MNVDVETQRGWFAAKVRAVVNAVMENDNPPDADGDFVFHGETSFGYLQPLAADPWGIRFLAIAAREVPNKVGVLRELNEVNIAEPLLTAYLAHDGTVVVTYRLAAEAVTEVNVRGTLLHVIDVADRVGQLLTAVHGGTTPKPLPRPAVTE